VPARVRFLTFLPMILALCTCQRAAPREALPPGGTRTHVWVVAGRPVPGDGTRERPLHSLAEALARPGPLTVHLGGGTYLGPFTLPEGVRVEGLGSDSVLSVEGADAPVLRAGRAGPAPRPASAGAAHASHPRAPVSPRPPTRGSGPPPAEALHAAPPSDRCTARGASAGTLGSARERAL
jgi:hypothetical protein